VVTHEASPPAAKEPGVGDEVTGRMLLSTMNGTPGRKTSPPCQAEPIRCAQGKIREASRNPSLEILRFAQDDTVWQLWLMLICAPLWS
jgi:hypothetical protein